MTHFLFAFPAAFFFATAPFFTTFFDEATLLFAGTFGGAGRAGTDAGPPAAATFFFPFGEEPPAEAFFTAVFFTTFFPAAFFPALFFATPPAAAFFATILPTWMAVETAFVPDEEQG